MNAAPQNQTAAPSELRYDLLSKNWVLIATGRAKRPDMFKQKRAIQPEASNITCPFCDISGQQPPVLFLNNGQQLTAQQAASLGWQVVVFPNKFPAVTSNGELMPKKVGPFYEKVNAIGFHEVIVTKDHNKHIARMSAAEIEQVILAYQLRLAALRGQKFVNHFALFHNHGKEGGASIAHPHSQLITTPLVDEDLLRSLRTASEYWHQRKKCLYCQLNDWELKTKERLVYENEHFMAVCPFASKMAFETIVSPKAHLAYFEQITPEQRADLAEAFRQVLSRLYKGLNDPPYNFYLHTAPPDGFAHDYYHWHFTFLPHTSVQAGFEMGTHMEISSIEPEKAAGYLRVQQIDEQ